MVIAGAGSGKTALMAARVVYLVATGQVTADRSWVSPSPPRPPASSRGASATAWLPPDAVRPVPAARALPADDDEALEPTVATYNAYAAALLTEHGLRIGHEPDTRVMADASRYQLAARAIARHTGRIEHLSDHPETRRSTTSSPSTAR